MRILLFYHHVLHGGSIKWRMVIKLCLGVDVAEAEDEKFGVVDAVEFRGQ